MADETITNQDLDLLNGTGLEDQAADPAELWKELDTAEQAAEQAKGEEPADAASDADTGKEPEPAAAEQAAAAAEPDAAARQAKPDGAQPAGKDDGKATEQPAEDIWAGADPRLKAAFDAAQGKVTSLTEQNRRARGQVSALQRQINGTLTGSKPRDAAGTTPAASAKGGKAAATDDTATSDILGSDDWKSLKEMFPEVAGPLEKVIGEMRGTIAHQGKVLEAIGDDRQQAALNEQADLLTERHPDWLQTIASNEAMFRNWLEHQPRHIREAAQRNAQAVVDAEEASDVVGRFKAYLAHATRQPTADTPSAEQRPSGGATQTQAPPLSDKRKRQLESSTTARSRGAGATTVIPDDPEGAWKAFEQMGL